MKHNVLNPSVKIKCKGKSFKIGVPNIGEYIQIESLKQAVTNGRYAIMAYGGLESSEKALDLVDAVIYFSVLGGDEFLKTYNAKDHTELLAMPINDSEELIGQYKDVYAPFYNTIVVRKDRPIQKQRNDARDEKKRQRREKQNTQEKVFDEGETYSTKSEINQEPTLSAE